MTTEQANAASVLRRDWQRWTRVVGFYARRGWRRLPLPPDAYGRLRAELLAACEALAATAGWREREFYKSLAELVRPWLSSRSLAATDRDSLTDLWERCRLADRRLRGAVRAPSQYRYGSWLGLSLAALALLAALACVLENSAALFGDRFRWTVKSVWYSALETSHVERLGVLAGLVVVLLFALRARLRHR